MLEQVTLEHIYSKNINSYTGKSARISIKMYEIYCKKLV